MSYILIRRMVEVSYRVQEGSYPEMTLDEALAYEIGLPREEKLAAVTEAIATPGTDIRFREDVRIVVV